MAKVGVERVYEEKISGRTVDRIELSHCLKSLREVDTLVVWRLDRLGRSLKHLISIIEDLGNQGVRFMSLQENIDTTPASGKLLFHMMATLAEFERSFTVERVRAGLEAARARGRRGGRPRALSDDDMKLLMKLWEDKSISVSSIVRRFNLSRSAIHMNVRWYQEAQIDLM